MLLATLLSLTSLVAVCVCLFVVSARVAFRGDALRLLVATLHSPRDAREFRRLPFVTPTDADCSTITRALLTGRIMLLSFVTHPNGYGADVTALGENGHVYRIALGAVPRCSCPSFIFKRTAQCKHLAWLKVKVLGVPANHYLVCQRAYLRVELNYLVNVKAHALAPRPIREALGLVQSTDLPVADVCAICYEDFVTDTGSTTRCASQCRKVFHELCVGQYHASLVADGKEAVCACCRAVWVADVSVSDVVTNKLKYKQVSHPHGDTPRKRSGSVSRSASQV